MNRKIIYTALTVIFSLTGFSQKIKIQSGNADFLKDAKEINIQFDYSSATFYKDNKNEKEYIANKEKDLIDKKGKEEADKWLKDWAHTKSVTIPHKFSSSVNKHSKESSIIFSENKAAKYTLIIETLWIYPGWYGGAMKSPSKLNTTLKFVETANPNNVLLTLSCTKAYGDYYMVGVPNTNDRIAEAYSNTGKGLAKWLNKQLK